jgi:hypothetical protein
MMDDAAPKQPSLSIVTVEDKQGRSIEVRKLKPIERMRLFQMIGAENAMNGPYLGYANLAYSVSKLEGEAVPVPQNVTGLEAMVKRLDQDGLDAVGEAFKKLYPDAAAQEEAQADLKN